MIYEMIGLDRCKTCKNYFEGINCRAYPNGIPQSILKGVDKHLKSLEAHTEMYWENKYKYPSDNGITYEPKK